MNLFRVSYIIFFVTSFIGCSGDENPVGPDNSTEPVLTTTAVSAITQTTAQCGGHITSDGGAYVTVRGVCWSTNPTPTAADNETNDGSGTGSFISSIAGLASGKDHYVRAYATNSAGTGYGSIISFTTPSSLITVTDIDGNVYQTVTIGTQVWMAENLKVTHYRNGEDIPNAIDSTAWYGLTTGAYCEYENDISNVSTYGRLYNWFAVADSRSIAPTGWHVPTDAEWQTLIGYLGYSNVGGKMKETGTTHWSWAEGVTNECGFSALPGGYRSQKSNGWFLAMGLLAYFWSSTEGYNNDAAYSFWLSSTMGDLSWSDGLSKRMGFSVRCVRN